MNDNLSKDLITKSQVTKIWASAKEINLQKDHLYTIIFAFSEKESMRDLTKMEAHKVIEKLIELGASSGQKKQCKKTPSSYRNIIAKMTPGQKNKILAQMYSLKWTDETLNDFAMKICKKPWVALTKEKASDLIEALKAILNKRNKANNL